MRNLPNGLSRLFWGLLVVLGICLFQDYGVSVDEPTDHLNGAVSGKYVAGLLLPGFGRHDKTVAQIMPLAQHKNNDHGVVFELPVAGLGRLLTHGQPARYFRLRHLLIFFTFVLGCWALFRLGTARFESQAAGLLAAGLLVLSPRMFGAAFFNGKDIVFLAGFTLAMYTLACLLARPTPARAVVHGLATAAAVGIRLPGLLLLAFTLGGLALLAALPSPSDAVPRRRLPGVGGLYLAVAALGSVACWPYLWEAPLARLAEALRSLSHYGWPFTTLYLGRFVPATQLPWHYVPVWLLITTPLPYTLAAGLGLAASLRQAGQQRLQYLRTPAGRLDLLVLGWLAGPVLLVIGLHSTLYDGWRHLYFVYPALLLLAVRGLLALGRVARQPRGAARPLAATLLVLAGAETLRTAATMVRLHPFEHLYFSCLPPRTVEQQFERDYWGLAFRQGLQWVLAHDPAPRIPISSDVEDMLYANTLGLPAADRARLRRVPARLAPDSARYFLVNYRWHPQPYPARLGREVYTVRAGGVRILSVLQRP